MAGRAITCENGGFRRSPGPGRTCVWGENVRVEGHSQICKVEKELMKTESRPVSIAVVGSGYVGLVAAACFAEIGHRVICVDNDEAKVRTLKQGGIPIHEEHLPELLERHRGRSLE